MPDQRDVTCAQFVAADDLGESNECARVAIFLALAAILVSCSPLPPQPRPAHLETQITRNDQVILLPKADGAVGAVVVRQDDLEIVLDKAYDSAVIEGPGQVRQLVADPGATRETFATTLVALPSRPASYTVYFLKGEDELTAESRKEVENMLSELAKRQAAEISVIGHTDTVGSILFNDKLSLQRAKRVRQLLIARGIPPGNIAIAGRGERELLVATPDEVHEPKNRRVEINVR
jgi:outer membrane protein OmpA-like peptidoglycan-associated protein